MQRERRNAPGVEIIVLTFFGNPMSIATMLDIFLGWFVIAIPFLLAVGATVLTLRLPHEKHYWKFVWGAVGIGLLFSGITYWQQARAASQAIADRNTAINETAKKTARQTTDDVKDALGKQYQDMVSSLTQQNTELKSQIVGEGKKVETIAGSPFVSGKSPVRVEVTNPNTSNAVPSAVRSGVLTISQTNKISTRSDAPYEVEVVIQSTVDFPSLKLAFRCDKEIVAAVRTNGGALMITRDGIAQGHPDTFLFQYESAAPQFGPANPQIFDVWTKEPATCSRVQTF